MFKSRSKPFGAVALATLIFAGVHASAQSLTDPSDWLDKLDREHNQIVSRSGHVHARGLVQAIDVGSATVTVLSAELQSPDNTIWMPTMRMVFHATNRRMLQGLQAGDEVEFEVARLRNAVMITNIRKAR
ncbi:MAG: copper-binding protein [Rhodospirillales bacterium]|nr:copper-binding protein [Rhodospirillales bacterium]